jgi:predicted protein tyrosine phosphatase
MPTLRLLFLCSVNRMRSPTAESIFSRVPGLEVRSAGLDDHALNPCTAEDILFADQIFVMEQSHLRRLKKRFAAELAQAPRPVVLGISDEFHYMQPRLIDLLLGKVPQFLPEGLDLSAARALQDSHATD